MTLDRLRPLADRFLGPFVVGAKRTGVSPDAVSVFAFLLAVAAGLAFFYAPADHRLYLVGAGFVFCNGWLDLLDGALARELAVESATGDVLDHVLDRYADVVIVVGLAGGIERYALGIAAITGVLMTSYLGTQAIAAGMDRVYGGLLGRADRLVLVGLAGLLVTVYPDPVEGFTIVGWLLVVFAVVGHVTALQRFYLTMRHLG